MNQSQGDDAVSQLRGEIEQLKKSQKDTVDKQYEATLKQYRHETDSLLEKNPREFTLLRKQGQEQAVVDWIVNVFENEDGRVISVEQAAREVESYLRQEAKSLAEALREAEPEETKTERKLPPPQRENRTLTNAVESVPTRTYGQFQHLSPKERLAQAMARASRG